MGWDAGVGLNMGIGIFSGPVNQISNMSLTGPRVGASVSLAGPFSFSTSFGLTDDLENVTWSNYDIGIGFGSGVGRLEEGYTYPVNF